MNTNLASFRTVQIVGTAAFLAAGLLSTPSLQAAPSAAAQIAAISSMEGKLAFLQKNAEGLSASEKAALGAAVIGAANPAEQKQLAGKVAQILATGDKDAAKVAALLVDALPSDLQAKLAGSIAIGAGKADPAHLPQLTAAVIAVNPVTRAAAPGIAGEVTAAAPLAQGCLIATAIGSTFSQFPELAKEAPQIAASMVGAMVTKGTIDQVRKPIANTVAALTALLPGTISSNQALIAEIGRSVAAVISGKYPGLATTIVGVTSSTLKAAAGDANIAPVLASFRNAFRGINDPTLQTRLDVVAASVNDGNGVGEDFTSLPIGQGQPEAPLGSNVPSYPGAPGAASGPGAFIFVAPPTGGATPTPTPAPTPRRTGPVNPPETPVTQG
ncbi:MAG: hypothetical protein PHQ12_00440 [Chthoniobacteraceae bacterium]|nr:hypothetical protein [Chthoniobacteraceae bacterium]